MLKEKYDSKTEVNYTNIQQYEKSFLRKVHEDNVSEKKKNKIID